MYGNMTKKKEKTPEEFLRKICRGERPYVPVSYENAHKAIEMARKQEREKWEQKDKHLEWEAKLSKQVLKEIKLEIDSEKRFIEKKPFSHNVISMNLRVIANKFGKKKANQVIKELGLEELGWKQEKVKKARPITNKKL